MEKYYLKDILKNSAIKVQDTQSATIYYLRRNNQILKVFNSLYLNVANIAEIDLEKKILLSEETQMSPYIIKPTSIVYDDYNRCVGYTTNFCKEQNLNQYCSKLTLSEQEDLYQFAKLFRNIENAVKTSPNIIIPDLCSCDNILVGKNNTIKLIDYDGFQVKDTKTAFISSTLGNQEQYINSPKYYQNDLFTKELDKKSLIILYFLTVFNKNLANIGKPIPNMNRKLTLDDIFYDLSLFDNDFNHKNSSFYFNCSAVFFYTYSTTIGF